MTRKSYGNVVLKKLLTKKSKLVKSSPLSGRPGKSPCRYADLQTYAYIAKGYPSHAPMTFYPYLWQTKRAIITDLKAFIEETNY